VAQAAIRAGYSAKTAREIGHQKLTKLHIAAAIEKARAKRAEPVVFRASSPGRCVRSKAWVRKLALEPDPKAYVA
jgi:phage terminase small subunit